MSSRESGAYIPGLITGAGTSHATHIHTGRLREMRVIVDMASRARRVQRQIERLEEEPAIATEDAALPPIPHVFDTDGM